jgi:hypothetical protein
VDEKQIPEMVEFLTGNLMAYELLCWALIKTHPDREKLYEQFLANAKNYDAETYGHPLLPGVTPFFEQAYGAIVKRLKDGSA